MKGTYHQASPKHLPRYLAEFCYRFNRRFDLAAMLPRLGVAAACTMPIPYRLLNVVRVSGATGVELPERTCNITFGNVKAAMTGTYEKVSHRQRDPREAKMTRSQVERSAR